MPTARELLASKGHRTLVFIGPEGTVLEAVTHMVSHNVGAILVMEEGQLRGIMTERDYLRFVTDRAHTARDTPVRELMTSKIIYATPGSSVQEVMAMMTEACVRHIPIMDEGALLGIISIGDCVKQISHDQEVKLRTLEAYINDPYPGPQRD